MYVLRSVTNTTTLIRFCAVCIRKLGDKDDITTAAFLHLIHHGKQKKKREASRLQEGITACLCRAY